MQATLPRRSSRTSTDSAAASPRSTPDGRRSTSAPAWCSACFATSSPTAPGPRNSPTRLPNVERRPKPQMEAAAEARGLRRHATAAPARYAGRGPPGMAGPRGQPGLHRRPARGPGASDDARDRPPSGRLGRAARAPTTRAGWNSTRCANCCERAVSTGDEAPAERVAAPTSRAGLGPGPPRPGHAGGTTGGPARPPSPPRRGPPDHRRSAVGHRAGVQPRRR